MLEDIIAGLIEAFKKPLPGIEVQYKMAPYSRITRKQAHELDKNPKLSATLALLFEKDNTPHILLMLRNSYNGVHSSQVSFPGGRVEEYDRNFQETALREFSEETGMPSSDVQIIGKLTDVYIPPSRFLVYPFVGFSRKPTNFFPDSEEVAELIEMPLQVLLDDATIEEKEIHIQSIDKKLNTPAFIYNDYVIWGATAMMLSELKEMIKSCLRIIK